MKRLVPLLLAACVCLCACGELGTALLDLGLELFYGDEDFVGITVVTPGTEGVGTSETAPVLAEDGNYYSASDVALYVWTYKHLPQNYITKAEARALGWEGGTPEKYRAGAAIGGDRFANREGILPEEYTYRECDIDTNGASSRGARRIVYTDDCSRIYYTEDHYETFVLLYPEG